MKLRPHVFVVATLCALASSPVVLADTVFYANHGGAGIASVTGTIVKQTSSEVVVTTSDGKTVSIPGDDVFQIVRENQYFGQGRDLDPGTSRTKSTRNDHYGLKGGLNISDLSTDPAGLEDSDQLHSFAIGAWYGLPLNPSFTFQPEMYYSVKGDAASEGGYTTSTKVSYLDVPVLAKMGFMHDASVRPSLFAGPSMALNLSAKSKFEGEGSDIEVDVKDQLNTFDLGFVVGGGVDIPWSGRSVGLELRYSKGLTNAAGEDANGDAHNNVLAVLGSFGWK
jgi:hypothetical protein